MSGGGQTYESDVGWIVESDGGQETRGREEWSWVLWTEEEGAVLGEEVGVLGRVARRGSEDGRHGGGGE